VEAASLNNLEQWNLTLFSSFPNNRAENVGKGVLHMICEGKPGSIWISASNKPAYQIEIPQYEKLRV
jgi:hypothetical protein